MLRRGIFAAQAGTAFPVISATRISVANLNSTLIRVSALSAVWTGHHRQLILQRTNQQVMAPVQSKPTAGPLGSASGFRLRRRLPRELCYTKNDTTFAMSLCSLVCAIANTMKNIRRFMEIPHVFTRFLGIVVPKQTPNTSNNVLPVFANE